MKLGSIAAYALRAARANYVTELSPVAQEKLKQKKMKEQSNGGCGPDSK